MYLLLLRFNALGFEFELNEESMVVHFPHDDAGNRPTKRIIPRLAFYSEAEMIRELETLVRSGLI